MVRLRPVALILWSSLLAVHGFVAFHVSKQRIRIHLNAEKKKEGYKFGDITKSILGSTAKTITGKKDYKFGDITKSVVREVTGKDDYQFGDISKALDQRARARVAEFTGKADYRVGDISRQVLQRVRNGDYELDDILLMCKILLAVGAEFTPLASVLPAKILLEILNASLAQEVSGKLLEGVAKTLDKRFKETVTGDADYQMGDLTKKAIMKFVGKDGGDKYEFGDLTRTVSDKWNGKESSGSETISVPRERSNVASRQQLDPKLVAELEAWDRSLKLSEASKLSESQ